MTRFAVIAACLVSLAVASVEAGGYSVGYTYEGYTYAADGYWYNANQQPFILVEYTKREWDAHYCRWYNQTYYYWKAAPVAQVPVSYKDPKWREKVVDLLRDKQEADSFEATMQALGLDYSGGNKAYGTRVDINGGAFHYVPDQYSRVDINLMAQQLGLNGEASLKLAQAINAGHTGIVSQALTEASMVTMIRELKQAVIEMKLANQPAATVQTNGNVSVNVLGESLSMKRRIEIMRERLIAPIDDKKHMPQGGAMLTDAELQEFMAGKFQAIESRHKCTECHDKNGVKFRLK